MHTHRVRGLYRAADLSILERVLEELCEERGLTYEHPETSIIAARLLLHFESGVREPEKLMAAVAAQVGR